MALSLFGLWTSPEGDRNLDSAIAMDYQTSDNSFLPLFGGEEGIACQQQTERCG
jgi:hypothetical protein